MKTKFLIFSLIMLLFTSCEREESLPGDYQVELKGRIEEIGFTYWMYGTHKITYNGKLYALKSSTINLDKYLDKEVTIWGNKVNGYPVDSGPEYIDVKKVLN